MVYINFQIVFTDIDVQTLTKTSIIAEAPYGIGIVGIALIGVTCIYIRKRWTHEVE